MAYQRITLAELKSRLAERLGGQGNFWSEAEQEMGLNEALAAWQLLTGDFVSTHFVIYPGDGERLIDQSDTGTPFANTLRAKCLPFSINVIIDLEPGWVESDCGTPSTTEPIDFNYTITGAALPIVEYEWRNYQGSTDLNAPYTVVSTSGDSPQTIILPGESPAVPYTIRLVVKDSVGAYGISNVLSFCIFEPV
jgi:hypothetical protein